jgi:uncharacterized protein (UPF0332 family)
MTEKEEAISLKLKKADALMSEIPVLLQNQFYDTAINRIYYSCFHATKALLLTKDLTPKTHSGVVSFLHQHFVQPGLFDEKQASFFSKIMQERNEDDYSDFLIKSFDSVKDFIEPAKSYLDYVKRLIGNF